MIGDFVLEGCGPLQHLEWKPSSGFNVVIGENNTGKTMLLKLLYVLIRSLEEYKAGDDSRPFRQVIEEKLIWTYQVPRLGSIVTRGQCEQLRYEGAIDQQQLLLTIGKRAERGVSEVSEMVQHRDARSLFLPAREVISLSKMIRQSRMVDRVFGFDDTLLDLVLALDKDPTKGKLSSEVVTARRTLADIAGGKVELDADEWTYQRNGQSFPIAIAAEGVRKVAILERLLGSRAISTDSILMVDEPEASLHPRAVVAFLDALSCMVRRGLQVFVATHSFVVLKKLQLLARSSQTPTPVLSLMEGVSPIFADLRQGMPDNPIVTASLTLYREEIGLRSDA